jgi:hypothetical protein
LVPAATSLYAGPTIACWSARMKVSGTPVRFELLISPWVSWTIRSG